MLKIAIRPVTGKCPSCDDPRDVLFTYHDDVLAVAGVSYHHEFRDLLRFAGELRTLEQRRTGNTRLCSKNECSHFELRFTRTGGELIYSAQQIIEFGHDDDLKESVTYFGEVPSEAVGQFLTALIRNIESCQPGAAPNGGPAACAGNSEAPGGPPSVS